MLSTDIQKQIWLSTELYWFAMVINTNEWLKVYSLDEYIDIVEKSDKQKDLKILKEMQKTYDIFRNK